MVDSRQLFRRGIAFPPRVNGAGELAVSDGLDNVRESIKVMLLTEPGERLMLPGYGGGIRSFIFQPNTVATRRRLQERCIQALTRWEPRIRLQELHVLPDSSDPEAAIVIINYTLVATQAADQVTLQVSLQGREGG